MAVSSTSSGSLKTGVCLSTDRPDNPYNGQVIYETDTNRVLVYDNSAWVVVANAASTGFPSSLDTNTVDSIAALQAKVGVDSSAVTSSHDYKIAQLEALGEATAFTPVFENLTLGNGTVDAQYLAVNDIVFYSIEVVFGSTTSITSSVVFFDYPATGSSTYVKPNSSEIYCEDATGTLYYGRVMRRSGASGRLRTFEVSGSAIVSTNVTSTSPFTWATGDRLIVGGWYIL